MTTTLCLCLALAGIQPPAVPADSPGTAQRVRAIRLLHPITIDAALNESIWQTAEQVSQFVQRDPNEGGVPSESTVVYLAYDDAALYVGARLYDRTPDSIVARLGRRDVATSSDQFTFYVDSYHDRRSGFFFGVNAAGALSDGVLYNDDWDDNSWDGVWEGRARIDGQGWVVEMRIPYSQLRFNRADTYTFGINFRRDIARRNEVDYYVLRPKTASGFVSRFADLVGIERVTPPRRLEVMPYVTTQAAYTQHQPGDPFNDGSTYQPTGGVDIKAGLGSNLTLNATINPDFGQVEVDPAVVNLSDVETFFGEKRPFFIEGATIFDFGFGGASNYWGFNWPGPDMLHTRRMGRAPQGSSPRATFTERPEGANILGALKLTGKLGSRWNLGTLAAVTQREFERAHDTTTSLTFRQEVEPATYHGVFRMQREFPEGRQGLGTMVTFAVRDFADPALRDEISTGGYVAGVDGWSFLDRDKEWVVTGWVAGSHVRGSQPRILALQQHPVHYFQRPDAKNLGIDSGATALTGWAARFHLNKQKGNWFSNSAVGFISPAYETNDMGFMSRTGLINMHAGAGYGWRKPGKVFRNAEVIGALFQSYNWDRDVIGRGVWHSVWAQFLNYWSFNISQAYNPATWSDRRTRGGPLMRNLPGHEINLNVNSDGRQRIIFGAYGGRYSQKSSDYDMWAGFDVEFRPAPNLSVSAGPNWYWSKEPGQFVTAYVDTTANATYDQRYVFANLDYAEFSAGIRVNWTFSPTLSLQVYAQPLLSAGDYERFKTLRQARTFDFDVYGDGASTFEDSVSFYRADADGAGPSPTVNIGRRDFSFESLRGNAVLRWEYMPGSTLYFVWTQSRSDGGSDGTFRFSRGMDRMIGAPSDNIFMVKATYWWNP
ncbi:MAG: DUF5916 domain-containing protein [Gemmatimonadales bacterium]